MIKKQKHKVAVIMTVFNRKEETLKCLHCLYAAELKSSTWLEVNVYMTDDGSSDGVAESVQSTFENKGINILHGTGSLYWAGGMRFAWHAAVAKGCYDAYLLLNNDTYVFDNVFEEYKETDNWGVEKFGLHPICVGSTCEDENKNYRTYGGFNEALGITREGIDFTECSDACANILFIPESAVARFGVLYKRYIHGGADGDYTRWAAEHGWHNVLMRGFAGICSDDHKEYVENKLDNLCKMTLKERLAEHRNPTRLGFHDNLIYQWRFAPWRVPICWLGGWLRCLCPYIYKIMKTGYLK